MSVRNKLFLLVITAVFVLGGLAVAWWYQEGGPVRVKGANEYVLILGLDDWGTSRRTDTILVGKLEEQSVKLLSIPRDLRVKYPTGEFDKLNTAYGRGGVELTSRLISELLGVPLYWYAVVNYQGFTQFIDAIGGVTLTIERPMRYDDSKQNLHINLAAGTQTLNGQQALDFWRYRDAATGEDLGRIRRQQEFVKALSQKLAQVQAATVKELVEATLPNLQTNMAVVDVYRLVERLQRLRPENLQVATLPGQPLLLNNVSYFRAEPVETAALVAEFFQGRDVVTNRDVKVIVLNGHPDEVKRQGLAKKVGDLLQAQGFHVVAYWNAGDTFDYPQSYLINVSGDKDKAQRLRTALKISLMAMTPAEFTAATQQRFGEDRLPILEKVLRTTAVPPNNRSVELNEADLVLILGAGDSVAGGESN